MITLPDNTELLAAVEAADGRMISQCLQNGADINAPSENGWTPLMLAILHGSFGIVKLLLEQGADPNVTTRSEENPSRSALAVAIRNGRLEAVQALVAYGADSDARGFDGLTSSELAQTLALRPFHQEEITAIAVFLEGMKNSHQGRPLEAVIG